jgi:hypothetical protein
MDFAVSPLMACLEAPVSSEASLAIYVVIIDTSMGYIKRRPDHVIGQGISGIVM